MPQADPAWAELREDDWESLLEDNFKLTYKVRAQGKRRTRIRN